MARYIDAENFLALFDGVDLAETLPVGTIKILLHGVPTADVKPVVQAHWLEEEDCSVVTDSPWSMCAACGEYAPKLLYCAFCGAKMDEEKEG